MSDSVPFTSSGAGHGTFQPPADGYYLVNLWGGGGGGSQGVNGTRGGSGGGGSALSTSRLYLLASVVYDFFVGSGGVGGDMGTNTLGSDGTDSYWGATSAAALYRAQGGKRGTQVVGTGGGAGGSGSGSLGDTVENGKNGSASVSGSFSGQPGGAGGGALGGAGGVPSTGGGQGLGGSGAAPGGGGSGGGQSGAGDGGHGGDGQVYITTAPASTPGYVSLGLTAGTYQGPGQYDKAAEADGTWRVELWGSGGGGASGATSSVQGRAGGGGGACVRADVPVYSGVIYRRTVPAGGVGGAWSIGNFPNTGANGADATFGLAPVTVVTKQISGGVGILGLSTPCGSAPLDSITVSGVDATFNGTRTISSISADRKTIRFALSASDVAQTVSGGTVTANSFIMVAKGGTGALKNATGAGSGGAGGSATSSVVPAGGVKYKGEDGEDCWGAVTGGVQGTNGGFGGYPNGGIGGWGGKHDEDNNTVVAGQDGAVPGGGGGGGSGQNNSHGGDGADGAAVIRYIVQLASIVVNHELRPVVEMIYRSPGGTLHDTFTQVDLVHPVGVTTSQKAVLIDSGAGVRKKPSYIPAGYEDRFDVATGRFNWVKMTHIGPALAAKNFHWLHVGDSVSDGSYFLDRTNPLNFQLNYPTAYPRLTRASLASAFGTVEQGTGLVRPCNVATPDPMWARGSWADKTYYLESSTPTHVATFTPVIGGTAIRVTTLSKGSVTVTIDNVLVGTIAGGATDAAVQSQTFGGLSSGIHVVKLSPAAGTTSGAPARVLGVDSFTPGNGIKVHNVSQGGSRTALGSASSPQQNVWGDTGAAAPTNMTNTYKQYTTIFERKPDMVLIALGGNDGFAGIAPSAIDTAMRTVVTAFKDSGLDVVCYLDVHNETNMNLAMQMCLDLDVGMIDFFWLSRNLRSIFGLDYNGDTYGHPSVANGAPWLARLFKAGLAGDVQTYP